LQYKQFQFVIQQICDNYYVEAYYVKTYYVDLLGLSSDISIKSINNQLINILLNQIVYIKTSAPNTFYIAPCDL